MLEIVFFASMFLFVLVLFCYSRPLVAPLFEFTQHFIFCSALHLKFFSSTLNIHLLSNLDIHKGIYLTVGTNISISDPQNGRK